MADTPATPTSPATPARRGIFIPLPSFGGADVGAEARALWAIVGAVVAAGAIWYTGHLNITPTPAPNPQPQPNPPGPVVPATEFFRLGQQYKGAVLSTYADALSHGADAIAGGTPVDKALAAIGTEWTAARSAAFTSAVAPRLEAIAPAGSVPDPAKLAQAFRDLSNGVRAK